MSMNTILQQVLVIFGYVLVGWVAYKVGALNGTINKELSNIIVKITLPLSIVAAADLDVAKSDLVNMGLTVLVLLGSYIINSVVIAGYAKAKHWSAEQLAINNGLCVFPNSGFIGIPLCVALMGDRGMLYGAAGLVAFNSFFFTYQYLLFRPKEKVRLSVFVTPLNASVILLVGMLVFGLRLPSVVQTVSYNVGAMTTPLALMIVGAMLAEGDVLSLLRTKMAYVVSLLRNVVLPMAVLVVLALLPLDYEMKLATVIYAACPCANLTLVFGAQAGMDMDFCAKSILLSTMLFMATLPFILWVAQIAFA